MGLKVELSNAELIPRAYGKLYLLTPRGGLQSLQVLYMVIDPGQRTSKHYHQSEELFYLLQGRAIFISLDKSMEVNKGEAVVVPSGEPHCIVNPSQAEQCVFLIALSPPRQPSQVMYCE